MTILNKPLRASLLASVMLLGAGGIATAQSGSAAPDAPEQGVDLDAHRPEVPYINGLITSGHPLSSMAGTQILMSGGNAADAAVAASAVLNIVEPWASGIGGNGFLMYYDGQTGVVEGLSYAGAAPRAMVTEGMSAQDKSSGILAAIVPGAFGGWIALMEKHGSLTLADVLAPAVDLARNGHPIDPSIAETIGRNNTLPNFETSAAVFLPNGEAPVGWEMFTFGDLADTFERLVAAEAEAIEHGASREEGLRAAFDYFYQSGLADDIAAFYAENDGYLALEDLRSFEPRWDEPLHITYRGYDVYANPPTTRGGLEVLMQLKLVEAFDLAGMGHNSAEAVHVQAEAIKIAKSDIYAFVGDPAEFDIPVQGMLSDAYLDTRRELIDLENAGEFPDFGAPDTYQDVALNYQSRFDVAAIKPVEPWDTDGHTTSLSVIDTDGNVVVSTPTLGGGFGTGVVVGDTGILINNGVRHGSTAPYEDHINFVAPGRTPLLNNSPIVILKDGEFHMSVGSPGGETIGQSQFQVIVNALDFGMPIQEAVEAARFSLNGDFYVPGSEMELRVENRMPRETVVALSDMGHSVEYVAGYSIGSNQALLRNEQGTITAGADPRRLQYAIGF